MTVRAHRLTYRVGSWYRSIAFRLQPDGIVLDIVSGGTLHRFSTFASPVPPPNPDGQTTRCRRLYLRPTLSLGASLGDRRGRRPEFGFCAAFCPFSADVRITVWRRDFTLQILRHRSRSTESWAS